MLPRESENLRVPVLRLGEIRESAIQRGVLFGISAPISGSVNEPSQLIYGSLASAAADSGFRTYARSNQPRLGGNKALPRFVYSADSKSLARCGRKLAALHRLRASALHGGIQRSCAHVGRRYDLRAPYAKKSSRQSFFRYARANTRAGC